MLHKEFWGLLFLAFVVWIFVATTPQKRIEHGCRPIYWVGSVLTSGTALAVPSQQQTVQSWFNKLEYGCRYTTWRLFYQDDYNRWLAEEKRKEEAAAAALAKKSDGAAVAAPSAPEKPAEK